jgi:peptidoglycan/xylan/chitin deacetylase (PgdA/CDA1 family)
MKNTGKFIISLDFELLWGVRDHETQTTYGRNILGAREALPKILDTFNKYNVRATFATVGFLFASNKEELIQYSPTTKPCYINKNLSPYTGHFDFVKDSEREDKYHFASELIDLICKYGNHEIATHTYSHYYCLEKGQTLNDFKRDIIAAIEIAKKKGIVIKSLVFPRNQYNQEHLDIIKTLGITSYRGNEKKWFYKVSNSDKRNLIRRSFKLLDRYINISGHNCYTIDEVLEKEPFNIASSRFLSPYSSKLKAFESLKLQRILKSMTYAAKSNKIYHLWWHPHNFGINQTENFILLEKILDHYVLLNSEFGFESLSMSDLSSLAESKIRD